MLPELKALIELSRKLGSDPGLVQGAGGNTSIKISNELMLIKSSGNRLKDVDNVSKFCSVYYKKIRKFIEDLSSTHIAESCKDNLLSNFIDDIAAAEGEGKASIETAMHALLSRIVIHTHPIELNAVLCTFEAETILSEIISDKIGYAYIPYFPPGFYLAKAIYDLVICSFETNLPPVIFLQNHGIVVHGETCAMVEELHDYIFACFRNFFSNKNRIHEGLCLIHHEEELKLVRDIFPDTIVFRKYLGAGINSLPIEKQLDIKEIFSAAAQTYELSLRLGLNPKILGQSEASYILNMCREKYRQRKILESDHNSSRIIR